MILAEMIGLGELSWMIACEDRNKGIIYQFEGDSIQDCN